ncbi:nuclear transport factor 2 family protein [Chitinimonas naiadis]
MNIPSPSHPRADLLIAWFESLTPDSLENIDSVYSADIRFKDPFNDLQGLTAVKRLYAHMFATLLSPRFTVVDRVVQWPAMFLVWRFDFTVRGRAMCIQGGSHLIMNDTGRICVHRDYWDAAEELYEQLPLLGGLLKLIKRKFAS